MLHAILFDKKLFSLPNAKEWLRRHDYVPLKDVHETKGYWRFRISPPVKGIYYSKFITDGILFVFSQQLV